MMRLIDADALRRPLVLKAESYERIAASSTRAFYWAEAVRDDLYELDDAPTIDAEPVRHGRWLEDDYGFFHCSECGFEWDESEVTSKYCPDCGARMGGENDETA